MPVRYVAQPADSRVSSGMEAAREFAPAALIDRGAGTIAIGEGHHRSRARRHYRWPAKIAAESTAAGSALPLHSDRIYGTARRGEHHRGLVVVRTITAARQSREH